MSAVRSGSVFRTSAYSATIWWSGLARVEVGRVGEVRFHDRRQLQRNAEDSPLEAR